MDEAEERDDDMVLVIALACWHPEYMNTHLERANADLQQQATRQAEERMASGRMRARR